MGIPGKSLNCVVAAGLGVFLLMQPLAAQEAVETRLLQQLRDPDQENWRRVETDLMQIWSQSGSPAMDLLLQRGRTAIAHGDAEAAIAHLTALTDHAPDFAEGWNVRATAWYLAGRFGPSLDDIQRTLALNPNHFGALAGLGAIFEEIGREREALAAYRAAAAIHPHLPAVKAAIERLGPRVAGQAL